jgi:hypothetical protein
MNFKKLLDVQKILAKSITNHQLPTIIFRKNRESTPIQCAAHPDFKEEVLDQEHISHAWPAYVLRLNQGAFYEDARCIVDLSTDEVMFHPSVDTIFHWDGAWENQYQALSFSEYIHYPGKSLLLCGTWDADFFHFYCDTLGRVSTLNQMGLNLNEYDRIFMSGKNSPYIKKWIELLKINVEILEPPKTKFSRCDQLDVPCLPSVTGYTTSETIQFVKSKLKHSTDTNVTNEQSQLIYISRGNAKNGRKLLNESEIFENILKPHGYIFCNLELLNVEQQAKLFSNAKSVIAPHGAGLTNLIYSSAGISVLEIFGENYKNKCFYNLTTAIGGQHYYHISSLMNGIDFFVDPNIILEYIKCTDKNYSE